MIEAPPVWRTHLSFQDGHKFQFYSDGIALTEQYVAFTWFCIDRNTGVIRWQWEKDSPACQLFAVHQGVIIANTIGPPLDPEDLYLTRLEDGVALPQPRNFWERIVSLGGSGYAPIALGNGEILNSSGNVISLVTGRKIRKVKPEEFTSFEDDSTYLAEVSLPDGVILDWNEESIWFEGENAWRFRAKDLEVEIDSKVFHYPYAYLAIYRGGGDIASERWLWTLDLRNGQIVQRIALSEEPAISGTVHAVDDSGLVASVMRCLPNEKQGGIRWEGELLYFSRSSAQPDSTEDR
ncbi:MAG: hypothetical protein QM758_21390 [Armatimonas sp.]